MANYEKQILKVFDSMLKRVGARNSDRDQQLTGMLAVRGLYYTRELMVVGRAPNGYCCQPTAAELTDRFVRENFATCVADLSRGDPMRWVIDLWGAGDSYNTRRSAFWRVIRNTLRDLEICDVGSEYVPWSSHLVWSNLYKVSPADGGNPDNALIDIQLPLCKKMLRLELNEFKPKRLLFLTGNDWSNDFLSDRWFKRSRQIGNCAYDFVEDFGLLRKSIKFVVACHPQGKPEEDWTNEVVRAFEEIQQ